MWMKVHWTYARCVGANRATEQCTGVLFYEPYNYSVIGTLVNNKVVIDELEITIIRTIDTFTTSLDNYLSNGVIGTL